MTDIRVLVTGSRNWTDRDTVWTDLHLLVPLPGGTLTVVHGDCDTGADRHARQWCGDTADRYRDQGVTVVEERHPADWAVPCRDTCEPGHRKQNRRGAWYCPAAGNYRNQHMADLGADWYLAYPLPTSRGTWHCIRACEKAGIPRRNTAAVTHA